MVDENVVLIDKIPNDGLDALWDRAGGQRYFFVPCVDALGAKKIIEARGWAGAKKSPIVRVGIYRGMWGVLCERRNAYQKLPKVKDFLDF